VSVPPTGNGPGDRLPRQASLRRLRSFEVRPNRELGQNFLIDDNLLGVIAKAAGLDPRDVVLEVGGGLGVLSEHLAPRVAHLHVVEVDRTLEAPLRDATDAFGNVTLHFADAVALDLAELTPPPSKVVANLPYGIAATILLKSLAELPGTDTWIAMAQREVAERLAAGPGTKVYGATSVIVQLACEVRVLRRVPSSVFHPAPNVASALLEMRRVAPSPSPALVALVHAAFAHRRKALAGSLGLAVGGGKEVRAQARAALQQLGQPADVRAERLSPSEFALLAERLGDDVLAGLRPAGSGA